VRRKKTHKEFIEELKVKNTKAYEELEFLEDYKGRDKKIKVRTKYGEVYICPSNLLKGRFPSIESALDKTEYFKNELKEVNIEAYDNIEFLEEYMGAKKKILAKDKYGEVYVIPNNLLCGSLPNIQLAVDQTKYFINRLKEFNPKAYKNIEFLEDYRGEYKKIKARTKYGEVYIKPNNLLNGQFISIKSAVNKDEYFANQAIEINDYKYNYERSIYINAKTKVQIYCNDCKEYFWQTPSNHLVEQGCPRCNNSKGERGIEEYLLENNINFEKQKRFKECRHKRPLPFDFYLPDYNICIEYDGEQHYKLTRFRGISVKKAKENFKEQPIKDAIKDKYCEDNNIKLIRIPYTEFEKIEEILKNSLTAL